jgi:FAD/FMN-containing dehydrogenase
MAEVQLTTPGGQNAHLDSSALASFEEGLGGEVIYPGHGDYEAARKVWNGMIDRRPGAIVRCFTEPDVIATVNFARERNLLISVRSGGHNVTGHAVQEGSIVIDLSPMKGVTVDQERRIAVVQGGATLGDIDEETGKYGLAAPVGLVSATGVAGLTLHGGIGWQSRKRGLSVDNVVSMNVVTADGRLVTASEAENEDLYWALLGGGGNYGVVTSFQFKLFPIDPKVWLAAPVYPLDAADEGLRFYRDFIAKAPDELGSIAVLWSAPEADIIPKEHHGAPVLIFLTCYTGPFESGEEVLEPLKKFGSPIADLGGPMSFVDVQKFLDADYPDGGMYYWKSAYLNQLNNDVIAALVRHARNRPSPSTTINTWALGGQINRIDSAKTAFAKRSAPFMLGVESNWTNPDENEANLSWTREVFADMQQFTAGGLYLNFPGFAEEAEEIMVGTYDDNYKRLRRIKQKYDPENLFRGTVNIKPGA